MPGAYPASGPTLSGNLLTIDRLLRNPAYLTRRLNTIAELRFISDRILTRRLRTQGGAIEYEISEPILNARAIEGVAPGSEYPRDVPADGQAALAKVVKWGQAVQLTDEKLKRSVYMGDEVNRALRKTANTVIQKIDRLSTALIGSAVTNTVAATAAWNTTSPMLFRDVEIAGAKIVDQNKGYSPNTVLLSTTKYAMLITDPAIASLRRREASDNPIYGGEIESIGRYEIIATAASNLPSDDVWVFDKNELGAMADETEVDPGYAVMDNNLQFQVERVNKRDSWDIWARRITVPLVINPDSAVKLTGTGTLG